MVHNEQNKMQSSIVNYCSDSKGISKKCFLQLAFFFFKVKLRSWLMACFILVSNSDISKKGLIIQWSQQFIVREDGSLRTYWAAAHRTGEIHLVVPYVCQAEGVGTASVIGSPEGRNARRRSSLFLFALFLASNEKKNTKDMGGTRTMQTF